MTKPERSSHALRTADLSPRKTHAFALRPGPDTLASLAAENDLDGLSKLSFEGDLRAEGAGDWRLTGHLGATVVQPCAVTLAPVRTRIETDVSRLYVQNYVETTAPEAEMPEDDSVERLGAWIDPEAVMHEELALALPLYPRAEGVGFDAISVAEPGVAPMTDEDAKPFAGLKALRDRMSDDDSG